MRAPAAAHWRRRATVCTGRLASLLYFLMGICSPTTKLEAGRLSSFKYLHAGRPEKKSSTKKIAKGNLASLSRRLLRRRNNINVVTWSLYQSCTRSMRHLRAERQKLRQFGTSAERTYALLLDKIVAKSIVPPSAGARRGMNLEVDARGTDCW